MDLRGVRWRTLVSHVRLGGDEYRVVRPARPLPHAPLYDTGIGGHLSLDRAATVDLACAWWLAARSRRSIVYLPLRESPATCDEEVGGERIDLVLLHHSLGFPVSRWKRVRARLAHAVPHTVRLPAAPFPDITVDDRISRSHNDFRDHLRWDMAARTLFLVGSRRAFDLESRQLRTLIEHPDTHREADMYVGRAFDDTRRPITQLHLESCREHR
ncbi:hypothetical protein [Actinophytocola sp. KF-1]